MVASNFSGTVTSNFSTILESFNTEPSNLRLLAMLRSLSEYSFTDSDSFIFCNSKTLTKFRTFIPRILSTWRSFEIELQIGKLLPLIFLSSCSSGYRRICWKWRDLIILFYCFPKNQSLQISLHTNCPHLIIVSIEDGLCNNWKTGFSLHFDLTYPLRR